MVAIPDHEEDPGNVAEMLRLSMAIARRDRTWNKAIREMFGWLA